MSILTFTSRHWLAIGMVCSAIAAQGSSMHSWSEVMSPGFVFGALGSIGAVLVAISSDKPDRSSRPDSIRPDRFLSNNDTKE